MTPSTFHADVSSSLLFKGRPGDPRLGEWVNASALIPTVISRPRKKNRENIVIWGCPDDTGVLLNRGRAGAKGGPDSIRKHLYKMTPPMDFRWEDKIQLWDYGNLVPTENLNETHRHCRQIAAAIIATGATLIVLGGGHDFAAPNFSGFVEGFPLRGGKEKRSFGLINVDPHLDVRERENGLPHSGTPFREILDSKILKGENLIQFGTRANRNARIHYEYCRQKKVTVLPLENLRENAKPITQQFELAMNRLSRQVAFPAVTFDMDSCSEAEGVSAAPVLGFTAYELCKMAETAGQTAALRYFEIAEVAPALDNAERSSRIAAEMVFAFLRARASLA